MKLGFLQPYFQRLSAMSLARLSSSSSTDEPPETAIAGSPLPLRPNPASKPAAKTNSNKSNKYKNGKSAKKKKKPASPPIGQFPANGDPSHFLPQLDHRGGEVEAPRPVLKKRKIRPVTPRTAAKARRNLTPQAVRVSSPAPTPTSVQSYSTPSSPVSSPAMDRAEMFRKGYGVAPPNRKSSLAEIAAWYSNKNSPRGLPSPSQVDNLGYAANSRMPLQPISSSRANSNSGSLYRHREKRHFNGSPLGSPSSRRPSKFQRVDNGGYSSRNTKATRYSSRPPYYGARPF